MQDEYNDLVYSIYLYKYIMGITSSANEYLPQREDGKTNQELELLQKEITLKKNIIKDDNINFEENDAYKNLTGAALFDKLADDLFTHFINEERDSLRQNLLSKATPQEKTNFLQSEFRTFLNDIINKESPTNQGDDFSKAIVFFKEQLKNINTELINANKTTIEITSLEINILKNEIFSDLNTLENSSGSWSIAWYNNRTYWQWYEEDLWKKDKKDKNKEQKINNQNVLEKLSYPLNNNYLDTYDPSPHFWYVDQDKKISWSDHKVENIYDDRGIKRVMENIFDPKDVSELRRNTFGVNLDADHGLAYVVWEIENIINKWISDVIDIMKKEIKTDIQLQKEIDEINEQSIGEQEKTNEIKKIKEKNDKKKTELPAKIADFTNRILDTNPVNMLKEIESEKTGSGWIFAWGWLTDDELKIYFGDNEIDYKKERGMKWIDNEHSKIAKILNRAKWTDLLDFAEIMKARKNPDRVLKEWFNAKETSKSGKLDENNILRFLADINGDAIISADNNRKNKEQFKYGDLGNLSGEQIFFTMNQAIETQDALKWDGEWEKTVIKNIARMIDIMAKEAEKNSDVMKKFDFLGKTDLFSPAYKNALKNISENPSKANLLALIKNYPQSKVLFLAALEKIGGGSSLRQPDLYDILVGQEGKRLQQIDTTSEIEFIRKKIDNALLDPKFQKIIETYWIIEVRESIMQKTIEALNNIEISLVLDPASNQDMIMSGVTQTFYEEQARKTILGDINIQNISLGTNLNEIKLWYQIGKSNISSDGRHKYHIAGGPSFYLGKDGKFGAGIDINFSVAEQINSDKATSASLSNVQQAKYLGVEWWAGAKASKEGIGLYALLWVSTEKDALMGISQLENVYQQTSNRIFSLDDLTVFTPEAITNKLLSNIQTLKSKNYRNFIENNTNKLTNDINQTITYLKWLGIIDEIVASKKTNLEKQQAISSLLKIIQQGNIDQRKGDIIMNLHNDLKFTKFSAGLSAGTWFFGTKKDSYTGNGTTGEGTEIWDQNDPEINGESWSPSWTSGSWGEARLSFLGVYVGARLSTWKNTYLPNAKQLIFTEQEMNQWIVDHIEAGKDLEKYAKYLTGLFNKEGLSVTVFEKDNKKYLDVRFVPTTKPAPSLDQLLNIHYNVTKSHEFLFVKEENRLLIGNVWPIMAYTTTLPGKIDRVLCLGARNLNDKNLVRLKSDNKPSTSPSGIEFIENGFEFFGKEKLDPTIDLLKKDTQLLNDANAISLYKSLFDADGKLVSAPNDVTYTSTLTVGQQFSTGKITLYKNIGGKYILDYQPSTDNKLHMEYKTLGTMNEIQKNSNPDLAQTFANISLPNPKNVADIEHGKMPEFNNFIKNITSGNFDDAEKSLINIIGVNSPIGKQLQNGSPEEKQYIIDSYVSILAYEKSYEGQTINEITGRRWRLFLNYQWPGKSWFTENLKTELLKNKNLFVEGKSGLSNKKNGENKYETFTRETPQNIFWYTAFYRAGVTDPWYGATPFGKTNIIQKSLSEIWKDKPTEEQKQLQLDGKQRIVDNLAKDERHTKLLIKQIKKSINNTNISKYLDEKNLGELITKGFIDIPNNNNTNPIDISSKKLILDSTAIFYLLGECINESLWLRINNIIIQENIDTYKSEANPDKKYSSPFYTRSNSISGTVTSEMSSVGFKWYKKLGEKSKPNNDKYPWDGNPWEWDEIVPTDDDVIDWE
jgi:hypothetical protein